MIDKAWTHKLAAFDRGFFVAIEPDGSRSVWLNRFPQEASAEGLSRLSPTERALYAVPKATELREQDLGEWLIEQAYYQCRQPEQDLMRVRGQREAFELAKKKAIQDELEARAEYVKRALARESYGEAVNWRDVLEGFDCAFAEG